MSLDGVVEHYYAAVACIAHHILEHLVAVEPFGIVACHEVVHHHIVMTLYQACLPGPHDAVGRAEQCGVDEIGGFGDVSEVVGYSDLQQS